MLSQVHCEALGKKRQQPNKVLLQTSSCRDITFVKNVKPDVQGAKGGPFGPISKKRDARTG